MGISTSENTGADALLDSMIEAIGVDALVIRCEVSTGRLRYVSPWAAEALSLPRSELIGRSWDDLSESVGPLAWTIQAALQDMASEGRAVSGRGKLPTAKPQRSVEFRVTPAGTDGPENVAMAFVVMRMSPSFDLISGAMSFDDGSGTLPGPDGALADRIEGGSELALLRAIVAGSSDAIFAKDLQGRYVLANQACGRLLGRPISEILGRDDFALHSPEMAHLTVEKDQPILIGGPPERYEVVDRHASLGERTYQVAKWTHRDPAGRPIGLVGVARDTTESRRQEEALRRREAQYRLLAENSTDMISLHDPAGNYLYASPACRRVLGHEPGDLVGHNAYEFMHPDDIAEVRRGHDQLMISPETIAISFRARQPDGTFRWVETTTRTVLDPATREVVEIHCSTRDITDRRRAEDELRSSRSLLRAVLDNSTAVIYAKDLDGRYLLMNRWFEVVFGMSQEKLLGRTDYEIYPEAIADSFTTNDRKVLEEGRPLEFEETIPDQDGLRTYLSIKCPILGPNGTPTAICGISTDITERKRYEEQLRIKNARLEESIRSERRAHEALKRAESQLVQAEKLSALGQMVAGVAHEINNPLAYVINNVAVLKRDLALLRELLTLYFEGDEILAKVRPELAARIAELAETIDLPYTLGNLDVLTERSGEGLGRIRQIVRDLRDFARPGEDGLHVADLNMAIASTVNIVTGPAHERGIELVADLKPLPRIICHSGRINQVLLNLLLNALDACGPGCAVTVRSRPEPGGVAIDIIDNGRGIDPLIRHKIFDPFFTTKAIGKGTGLGLSISYGIIHAHGGRIDVESEPGKGSRFTIHLPIEPPGARPQGT